MPEESIAAYINNIITFAIFIIVILFIFLLIFLLSRFFIYKSRRGDNKVNIENEKLSSFGHNGDSFKKKSRDLFYLKKDPYLIKTLFIFGLLFVFNIFFIFLIVLALSFVQHFQLGSDLFLILGLLFFLIVSCIYLVKSKSLS